MSLESERLHGQRAKELLDNPVWEEIWTGLSDHLESRALACNTGKEPELAADIIRCKQLLLGLKREAVKIAENGVVADIQIAEIEKHKDVKRTFER